jgi:hypothetical protein
MNTLDLPLTLTEELHLRVIDTINNVAFTVRVEATEARLDRMAQTAGEEFFRSIRIHRIHLREVSEICDIMSRIEAAVQGTADVDKPLERNLPGVNCMRN